VELPSIDAREAMIKQFIPDEKIENGVSYTQFAEKLEGYSGSDIKLVCKEACMKPLRRLMNKIEDTKGNEDNTNWSIVVDPKTSIIFLIKFLVPTPGPVSLDDVMSAISTTKSSAQTTKLDKYTKWETEFGSL
jgi:katanin p60 ATPase-containing subunit A1